MKKAKDIKKVTVMGWGAYRFGDTVGGGKVAFIEARIDPALVVMTVTVAYGQNSLSTGNVSMNWSLLQRAAPRIYQGTKVVQLNQTQGIQLLSDNDLTALMGHGWSGSCTAAAMNGDHAAQSVAVASVDYDGGLNVRFSAVLSGNMRINWIIVDSTNAGE